MAKIVKVYRDKLPSLILAGKLYHSSDRDESGTFSAKWQQWFINGWFDRLRESGHPYGNEYVGAMRMNGGVFEYWIGMFMQSKDGIPEQFSAVEIPGCDVGVAWIKGRDDQELYGMHSGCMEAFAKEGFKLAKDPWFIERYVCERFTVPDENGEVILDYDVTLE